MSVAESLLYGIDDKIVYQSLPDLCQVSALGSKEGRDLGIARSHNTRIRFRLTFAPLTC
jgi:hypothetical protein